MREFIDIKTPENVVLEYEVAGIGSRSTAFLLDTIIQTIIILLFNIICVLIVSPRNLYAMNRGWFGAFRIIMALIFNYGYFIAFELLMNGKTPGKKALGIRVIKDNGRSERFLDSLIRNLFRIIDIWIGVLFIIFSPKYKRLGDMAGGTVVIKERNLKKLSLSYFEAMAKINSNINTDVDSYADADLDANSNANASLDTASEAFVPKSKHKFNTKYGKNSSEIMSNLNSDSNSDSLRDNEKYNEMKQIISQLSISNEEYEFAKNFLNRRQGMKKAIKEEMAAKIALRIIQKHKVEDRLIIYFIRDNAEMFLEELINN